MRSPSFAFFCARRYLGLNYLTVLDNQQLLRSSFRELTPQRHQHPIKIEPILKLNLIKLTPRLSHWTQESFSISNYLEKNYSQQVSKCHQHQLQVYGFNLWLFVEVLKIFRKFISQEKLSKFLVLGVGLFKLSLF